MAKKELKVKEDTYYEGILKVSAPPNRRPGRAPKMPDNLKDCLADLQDHTEAWIRRSNDVWFDQTFRLLEMAVGAGQHEESPEWYEYAINRLLDLKDRAAEGAKILRKGKAEAKRRVAEEKKSKRQQKSKPASNPPPDETDYFGLDSGGS